MAGGTPPGTLRDSGAERRAQLEPQYHSYPTQRFAEKGAIREAGFVKRNKTYGRLYDVEISRADFYSETLFRGKGEKSIPMFFSMLLQSDDLTVETVEKLEKMLAERRKELEADS